MRKIFYSFLISCVIPTIISCGKTTEENVNDTVSKTNDTVFGGTDGSGAQCKSGVNFQKEYLFVRQVKQTNDCGYIAVTGGSLIKLNQLGEKVWEKKFTLKQKKHSNLGKASVLQLGDGGIFIQIIMELRNLILRVTLFGKTNNMATLRMPLNTAMDSFTLSVMS